MIERRNYEEEGRAVKATALARVLLPVMRRNPRLSIEGVEAMGPEARATVAKLAGVKVPSDRTWAVMVQLIRAQLARPR